jgi:DNA-binding transcriptional MerR regulator
VGLQTVIALTFTGMQPQLFLFDEEKNKKQDAPETTGASAEKNYAGETEPETDENDIAFLLAAKEKEAEALANPFAGIQKQQQDKVDMLLLTTGKKRGRKSFKDMDEEAILPEVPADDVLFQKQYYPTRVVADWLGITVTQLRSWENEFDILKPKKNGKGDRFFRPQDVKNLQIIYHLIRVRKFTVQGAKQYLEENKKKLQTTMQLTDSLNKLKQFLLELKAISG